ncbi:hypothetical protein MTR67_023590 [Solanum verrucosum]|uniref:Uncharacterized protein n=1 Tax=Solanum verrucosum TaxID=315347 RepID=A0AAF0TXS5_SOLVR|nr:hypothetical protein MTR67_023590 [Solanum verrucosum]
MEMECYPKRLPAKRITFLSEERHEPGRIPCLSSQENNQDKELTSNHREEPMQYDQEKLSTKETSEINVLRQMQGDENAAANHNQKAQYMNTKAITRTPQENQQITGGKAIWKVKDKINPNENAMQQSKEYGGMQPNSNIMETTGKSVNFAPNNYDHNFPPYNIIHNCPNEHEEGQILVQNRATKQSENNTQKDPVVDSKIPPPIKVSSNFDTYRPNHQRNNQSSPRQTSSNFDVYRPVQQKTSQNNLEQNLQKLPVNNSINRNNNLQIPDPDPPPL